MGKPKYQETKDFFEKFIQLTPDEKEQIMELMRIELTEIADNDFVFYNDVSDLQKQFLFDFKKKNAQTGIEYIDFIQLAISKYSERFAKIDDHFSSADFANRMIAENAFEIAILNDNEVSTDALTGIYDTNRAIRNELEGAIIEFERGKNEILAYLNLLLENEKINVFRHSKPHAETPEPETPEEDFSDNDDKVKVILLKKLGIIDFVKSLQTKPETITHTAEILSAITGINSKTLYSYILPMLQPYRDDGNKNSPYKNPENLQTANKTIHKLKIKDANL